jgi:acetyl-CoA synthetase
MSSLGFEDTDTFLSENRVFAPPAEVVEHANMTAYMQSKGFDDDEAFFQWSLDNRFEFWEDMAKELHWFEPWNKTFERTEKPFFKWFVDGKFNISYNCLDQYMETPTREKVAFSWEGNNGSTRTLLYHDTTSFERFSYVFFLHVSRSWVVSGRMVM